MAITKSGLEARFELQLRAVKAPQWVREWRFAPPRRWRIDFGWPERMAGIEVEGLTFDPAKPGRHQRAKGYAADCEKYNAALLMGIRVLRVTREHLRSGQALEWTEELLEL